MKQKRKRDFEDDGRTIADMSGVSRQRLIFPRFPARERSALPPGKQEQSPLSPEAGRSAMRGALAAAMLVALVFLAAGALFIWFLTTVW